MNPNLNKAAKTAKKPRMVPTVSAVFNDGSILEMVYQPIEKRSAFALWRDGQWKIETGMNVSPFHRWVPYSPNNNLIKNEVVLLPSEPEEYGSEELLLHEIQFFIIATWM
jgi:hypothetical protein